MRRDMARVAPAEMLVGADDRKGRPYGWVARGAGKESPSHGFAVPGRIATASVRTGFAMTHCKECVGRADVGIGPYESVSCGAQGRGWFGAKG